VLEKFRVLHGKKRVGLLTAAHLKAIVGDMADRPGAANNLLKVLRVLLRHAIDMGIIHDNPARNVRKFAVSSEGFHSWTEGDVAAFEAEHKPGSRAHLALSLLLYTGQRRSDVVRMGWQHITDNLLSVVQDKTREFLKIPFHPKLATAIGNRPRTNMTFLLTEAALPLRQRALVTGSGIAAMRRVYSTSQPMDCARPVLPASPTQDALQSKSKLSPDTRHRAKWPAIPRPLTKSEMPNRRSPIFCGQKVNKPVQPLTLGWTKREKSDCKTAR
jgi:integrase